VDHPVTNELGQVTAVSNMQAGAAAPWFLLDTGRAIKALVYQERIPYKLQTLDRDTDENVFMDDEHLYGVRARSNAGYGLWQMAFGSQAALSAANYELARAAMMSLKGDEGRPLNIKPDTLVVPPSLEGAGLRLLNTELGSAGATNEWKGTAKLIVSPWVI
jgi:phage major head subunit gpT-like protein